jgi:hypothetical protein
MTIILPIWIHLIVQRQSTPPTQLLFIDGLEEFN